MKHVTTVRFTTALLGLLILSFFPVQGAEADKGGACEDRIVLRDWGDFYNSYHNMQYHC